MAAECDHRPMGTRHGSDRRAADRNGEPRSRTSVDVRVQVGALPYRRTDSGELEVMLVTSRTSRRWIIPKGWPMKHLAPSAAAAREAFEEAGVRGKIKPRPLGSFIYRKRPDDDKAPDATCQVTVFALRVDRQARAWPERGQREALWLAAADAARQVEEPGLRELIVALAASKCPARAGSPDPGRVEPLPAPGVQGPASEAEAPAPQAEAPAPAAEAPAAGAGP